MFVSDWMTTKVYAIGPDDTLTDAVTLMKDRKIKHLPVLSGGKLKGIISDRDIRDYQPSRATSLDIFELNYLLAKARVKDIMRKQVLTATKDSPIEEAAMIMHDKDVGCLPVMDGTGMVGIISDRDIFRVLVDITGIRHGGTRVSMTVDDRPGSIREVADVLRDHGLRLTSTLTSYEGVRKGMRRIVIRALGKADIKKLRAELAASYKDVVVGNSK